jgi:hypothetical protein
MTCFSFGLELTLGLGVDDEEYFSFLLLTMYGVDDVEDLE